MSRPTLSFTYSDCCIYFSSQSVLAVSVTISFSFGMIGGIASNPGTPKSVGTGMPAITKSQEEFQFVDGSF